MNKSSKSSHPEPTQPAKPAQDSTLDLEFPDWNGQRELPSRLNPDEMLRYCESVLPIVQSFPGRKERRLAMRCDVEFRL